jgi:hypothetical protein
MINDKWSYDVIQKMIDDKIEENLSLDYKCSKSLSDITEKTKIEITKDISSFANSAGGIIIYGIKEFDEKDKKHLPERIDPIKRSDMPKERLEHIINNIKPRIENLKIEPVSINDNELIYVVEIEQSNTAHQAMDHRYYKRHNFQSVPMDDYEIRDIMNRAKNPVIDLEFKIIIEKRNINNEYINGMPMSSFYVNRDDIYYHNVLDVYARNDGSVYANYIHSYLLIPSQLLENDKYVDYPKEKIENIDYIKFHIDNSKRDRTGSTSYGPKRFEPILPQMSQHLEEISLLEGFLFLLERNEFKLYWDIYADNAPTRKGTIILNSIKRENIDNSNS